MFQMCDGVEIVRMGSCFYRNYNMLCVLSSEHVSVVSCN